MRQNNQKERSIQRKNSITEKVNTNEPNRSMELS